MCDRVGLRVALLHLGVGAVRRPAVVDLRDALTAAVVAPVEADERGGLVTLVRIVAGAGKEWIVRRDLRLCTERRTDVEALHDDAIGIGGERAGAGARGRHGASAHRAGCTRRSSS